MSDQTTDAPQSNRSLLEHVGKNLLEYMIGFGVLALAAGWAWSVDTRLTEIVVNQRHAAERMLELKASTQTLGKADEKLADDLGELRTRVQRIEDTRFTDRDAEALKVQVQRQSEAQRVLELRMQALERRNEH